MKKSILFSLMVIGAVAAMITAATSAFFTDQSLSTANVFSAGTLDLQASNNGTTFTDDVTATIGATNMAPGDIVAAPLTIKNNGTLGLRYVLTGTGGSSITNMFDQALTLAIFASATCDTTSNLGTPLYSGAISGAAFGTLSTPFTGARNLANNGDTDPLCFRVTWTPSASDNSYKNGSATFKFTFDSVQTKNNP